MKLAKFVLPILLLLLFSSRSYAGPLLLGETTASSDWSTIDFADFGASLINPVVFTSLPVNTNSSDSIAQVRNVSSTGFDVRLLDTDGSTLSSQSIDFLAIEAGTHTIGGNRFTAGTTTMLTQSTNLGGSASVSFAPFLSGAPGVLTSTQTVNDGSDAFMVSRVGDIEANGFELGLQTLSGGAGATTPNAEIVGWLAFEQGVFDAGNDSKGQGITGPVTNHNPTQVTFNELSLNDGDVSTYDISYEGIETPETISGYTESEYENLRFRQEAINETIELATFGQLGFIGSDLTWLSATGDAGFQNSISVFADEDDFNDIETFHIQEPISLLAFEKRHPDYDPDWERPTLANVPEPEAVWLLLAGLFGLSRRRTRTAC